jgi:hypothetical protein
MSAKTPIPACGVLIAIGLLSAPAALYAQQSPPDQSDHLEARLRVLEDREQIRQLMHSYGRFLDERNFTAFAELFAETDSEYISGNRTARGARAIGAMLQEIITANPSGFKSPYFHVFFNETIHVANDHATAYSQSAFIVPGANGNPEMVFFAAYDDEFIREGNLWKFKRRSVHGNLPAR